jgi:hypothetical protein
MTTITASSTNNNTNLYPIEKEPEYHSGGGVFGICKSEETVNALKKIINNRFDEYGYPKGSNKKQKSKIDKIAQPVIDKLNFKPNIDSDFGNKSYEGDNGKPLELKRAIRIYSQSTKGAKVLQKEVKGKIIYQTFTIRANGLDKIVPEAITGLNTIYMSGGEELPVLAFAHEVGHTKAGGTYIDHGNDKNWKDHKKINNVEDHENVFREWVGGLEGKGKTYQRPCYEESLPGNLHSDSNNIYTTQGIEMNDDEVKTLKIEAGEAGRITTLKNPKKPKKK